MPALDRRPRRRTATIAFAVALAAATPATAPFGGLIGDLFGEDGGGGCAGADDPLGGVVSLLPVVGGGSGGDGGGCPVVESAPLTVEGIVRRQEDELVVQTEHMLTQIDNMIRMRTLAGLDQSGTVAAALTGTRAVLARVGRVPWSVDAADADQAFLYPEALPAGWDAAALDAHRLEQHRLTREASRASKLATAEAVTGTEAYPARTAELMAALKACEGQTCALDTAVQATLLQAEVAARALTVQAAHARAIEGRLDDETAALERAVQHTRINWRGLDQYGGAGGVPAGVPGS